MKTVWFSSELFSWSLHVKCLFTLDQSSQCGASNRHAATDLTFLSVDQRGKQEVRDCESWAVFWKERRITLNNQDVSKSLSWHSTYCLFEPSYGMCFQSADILIQFLEKLHWQIPSKILCHTHQTKMASFSSDLGFTTLVNFSEEKWWLILRNAFVLE